MKTFAMLSSVLNLATAVRTSMTHVAAPIHSANYSSSEVLQPKSSYIAPRSLGYADLRIASAFLRYDNDKPYGAIETITLYIYNGGPSEAEDVVVKVGYGPAMNQQTAIAEARHAQVFGQPSHAISDNSTSWGNLTLVPLSIEDNSVVATIARIDNAELMELSVKFLMNHELTWEDIVWRASVSSANVQDPRDWNDEVEYTITPNHHDDGEAYWNVSGDLSRLDFSGLKLVTPISQEDLRIASVRARYNNNLPYGQNETLSFAIFNNGRTTAKKPVLAAEYTTSMDYSSCSAVVEEIWIPEGEIVSQSLKSQTTQWANTRQLDCRTEGWKTVCDLPSLPPNVLYRVNITYPMGYWKSYLDHTLKASVESELKQTIKALSSTSYTITPNHNNEEPQYWKAFGSLQNLDRNPTKPQGRRCSTGWLPTTPVMVSDSEGMREMPLSALSSWIARKDQFVMSYDNKQHILRPRNVTKINRASISEVYQLSFTTDGQTEQTHYAFPDTLVYLIPKTYHVGQDEIFVGHWIPIRQIWVGALIRGIDRHGTVVEAVVTDAGKTSYREDPFEALAPEMVSESHSFVVGTTDKGGIMTHNPRHAQCGSANIPFIMQQYQRYANRLVATTTPSPGSSSTGPRYCLRPRTRANGPAPTTPTPRILPEDIQSRDSHGNWLIYLFEEFTPSVVENARYAISRGHPWQLTYDPGRVVDSRRRLSTGQYQTQNELLHITTEELNGHRSVALLDRDEYPPAIAREGGSGAVVTYIFAGENRSAGWLVGRQLSLYEAQPGDTFRLAVIHPNLSRVELLGGAEPTEDQMECSIDDE